MFLSVGVKKLELAYMLCFGECFSISTVHLTLLWLTSKSEWCFIICFASVPSWITWPIFPNNVQKIAGKTTTFLFKHCNDVGQMTQNQKWCIFVATVIILSCVHAHSHTYTDTHVLTHMNTHTHTHTHVYLKVLLIRIIVVIQASYYLCIFCCQLTILTRVQVTFVYLKTKKLVGGLVEWTTYMRVQKTFHHLSLNCCHQQLTIYVECTFHAE